MTKSISRTVITRVVLLVALVAGLWFLVISPRLDQPALLRQQALDLDVQVDNLQRQYSQLGKDEAFQANLTQLNDQLTTGFPARPDVPDLIEQVTATAVRAGMSQSQVISVVPEDPVVAGAGAATSTPDGTPIEGQEGGETEAPDAASSAPARAQEYATMAVSITVDGSLSQVSSFLGAIEDQERLLFINEVSYESIEDGNVRATIAATSLLLSPLETPAFNTENTPAPSPTEEPASEQ